MKKLLSVVLALAMLTLVCFAFVGCVDEKDNTVIRLNEVTHTIFYAPQYLAMELGYFEEEGITIELTNGQGANNVMTALLTDAADIGLMGCEASIYVYLQGRKDLPKVVGQLTKRDGAFLVGRNPEPNFDYSNIEGKRVMMGRTAGMPAMILQYILNNKGYTNGDNIIMDYDTDFGNLAPTFISGHGDYVPLFEPLASTLQMNNQGYIVSGLGMDSGEVPYTVYTVNSSYLEKNPENVEKFLRAVWRGTEYLLSHTAKEIAPLLKPYFDTDVKIIESAVKNYLDYDVWNATPVTSLDAYNRLQDIMENAGELSARVAYDRIVDNTIAKKIK